MSAKAETLGVPVEPGGQWIFPENHVGEVPLAGPGCVALDGASLAVKARSYRPDLEMREHPEVYSNECIVLVDAINEDPYALGDRRHTGIEIELNAVDRVSGDPFDLYPNDEPLPLPGLEQHPELLRNTYEIDGHPSLTTRGAYDNAMDAVRRAAAGLKKYGATIDPASARMQDRTTLADVTPNPYVGVMVENLGDPILDFIGTGIHEHRELHIGYGPLVARYMRILSPYLNLGLQAAPFAFGEQTPRLGEMMNNDELRAYDGQQPQSVRYPTRFAASPDGGIGLLLAHDNVRDALSHADQRLTAGEISNPARHYGSHADVRVRYDAPSAQTRDNVGRLELCVKDTSALRVETLEAYGLLALAVVEQLEKAAASGEPGIARLHKDFPRLFGTSYGNEEIATKQLPRTHESALEIAYNGADAIVTNGIGEVVSAREHFVELVRFAMRDGKQLPKSALHTLSKSLAEMDQVERFARGYKDGEGMPSLRGYYETGVGTAAQWMILRSIAARAIGLSARDNMRSGTLDRAASFENYMAGR